MSENIDPKFCPTNKKRKRISFSNNLMLQELLSDGSTRIFEEKINYDENCSLISMEIDEMDESDSIFNKTVYDTCEMEVSCVSALHSPSKPLTQTPEFSLSQSLTQAPEQLESPAKSTELSPSKPLTPLPELSISQALTQAPEQPLIQSSELSRSPKQLHSLTQPLNLSLTQPVIQSQYVSMAQSSEQLGSPDHVQSPPPQLMAQSSELSSSPQSLTQTPEPLQSPLQPLTPLPELSPLLQPLTPSPELSISPSFPFSHSIMEQDIGDTLHDSVLIYIDEKSILQLSSEDSTPEQSIIQYQYHSTTFVADLCDEDSVEESIDNTLNFIDNRAASPVKEMLNLASIDTRLWSFISEINDEYAILNFLQGNFQALIRFDLQDDNLEVNINEFLLQNLMDQKIKEKGWTQISAEAVYILTKPRDEKIIKVIKNLAYKKFENYKKTIPTTAMLNDVMRGICRIFNRLEALAVELAALSLRHDFKIINGDINTFEIALATCGVRHILWVVLCLDLTTYPDIPCKIKFGIHKADLKLYPYHLLNRAARNVSPGDGDYLRSIIRAIKKFICDYRLKHSRKAVRISFAPKRSIMCTEVK